MKKLSDKSKFLKLLLTKLNKQNNFETCLEKTLNEMKVSSKLKEKIINEMFAHGIDSFIAELNFFINERMNKDKPSNFKKFKINEKIRFLIIHRIKIIDKYFDKKIIFKLIFKQKSFPKLNKMLFKISDEMWFISGDSSTDFNFYSKRFILMNIYTSSFIYNLKNNSKDYSKTENFINKQIDSVLKFGRLKSRLTDYFYSKSM